MVLLTVKTATSYVGTVIVQRRSIPPEGPNIKVGLGLAYPLGPSSIPVRIEGTLVTRNQIACDLPMASESYHLYDNPSRRVSDGMPRGMI